MFHTVSSIGVGTSSKIIAAPVLKIVPSAKLFQIKIVAVFLLNRSRKNLNSPGIKTHPFESAV